MKDQQKHNDLSVQTDPVTGDLILRKELRFYNLQVFQYLKDHPCVYVPGILAFHEENGKLTVDEEYISGHTLKYMMESGLLSEERKKEIILSLFEGISFLHHARPPVIHRDLKPENILIADDGQVKIIDYDAAKTYTPGQEKDTVLIGTEGRAAPEQYGFGASDVRTDIYAVGILLKQMFPEDGRIRRIAEKATELDPDKRFQNIEELRDAFCGKEHHSLLIPPGFRTKTPWKMITAVIIYIFMIFICTKLRIREPDGAFITGRKLYLYRIISFLMMLSLIDLFTDWTHLYLHIPYLHAENLFVRYAAKTVTAVLIMVFWLQVLILLA